MHSLKEAGVTIDLLLLGVGVADRFVRQLQLNRLLNLSLRAVGCPSSSRRSVARHFEGLSEITCSSAVIYEMQF